MIRKGKPVVPQVYYDGKDFVVKVAFEPGVKQ